MPSKPVTNVPRQLTRRSVFEALLHRSPISRADLAKVTGLSKQTTSEVIDAFEQQGLVHPIGRTSGSVGRTAVLYELSREGGHVLGIDLGARRLTVALARSAREMGLRCKSASKTLRRDNWRGTLVTGLEGMDILI